MKARRWLAALLAGTMVLGSVASVSAEILSGTEWWIDYQTGTDTEVTGNGSWSYTIQVDELSDGYGAFMVELYDTDGKYLTTTSDRDAWFYAAEGNLSTQSDGSSGLPDAALCVVEITREDQNFLVEYFISYENGVADKFYSVSATDTNIAETVYCHAAAQVGTYTVSDLTDGRILTDDDSITINDLTANPLPVSGTDGDLDWSIDESGLLTITGDGDYVLFNVYNEENDDYYDDSYGDWRDYSRWITSAYVDVTGINRMDCMFKGCYNLTSVEFSDATDTSAVTTMGNMFEGCSRLQSISWGSVTTESVIGMNAMFLGCESLESLDLSFFDTSIVISMDQMFESCSSLTSIDVSSFDTSKVTNMYRMFCSCSSLTLLDVSSFDTSNVTNMHDMFAYSAFTSLDLSSFDTSCVTNMEFIFNDSGNLESITIPAGFGTGYADRYEPEDGQEDGSATVSLPYTENYYWVNDSGDKVEEIALGADSSVTYTRIRETITGTSGDLSWEIDSNGVLTITGTGDYAQGETDAEYSATPNWWYHRDHITSAVVNVSGITSTECMFFECYNMTSIDVTGLDMSSVTTMRSMFDSCNSLTEITGIGSWDVSNVTDAAIMFWGNLALTSIDLSSWNTSSFEDISQMFQNSTALTSVDISGWDTSNVTNAGEMLGGDNALTEVKIPANFVPQCWGVDLPYTYGCYWVNSNGDKVDYIEARSDSAMTYTREGDPRDTISGNVWWEDYSVSENGPISGDGTWTYLIDLVSENDGYGFVVELSDSDNNYYFTTSSFGDSWTANDLNDDANLGEISTSSIMDYSYQTNDQYAVVITRSGSDITVNYYEIIGGDALLYASHTLSGEDAFGEDLNVRFMAQVGTYGIEFSEGSYVDGLEVTDIRSASVSTGNWNYGGSSEMSGDGSWSYVIETVYAFGDDRFRIEIIDSEDSWNGISTMIGTYFSSYTMNEAYGELDTSRTTDVSFELQKGVTYVAEITRSGSVLTVNYYKLDGDTAVLVYAVTYTDESMADTLYSIPIVQRGAYNVSFQDGAYVTGDEGGYTVEDSTKLTDTVYGQAGSLEWNLTPEGTLTISGNGDYATFDSYGNVEDNYAGWRDYADWITKVVVNDVTDITYTSCMFAGLYNATEIDLSGLDTTGVTNMGDMFTECSSLTSLDVSKFDTSSVTVMSWMFCDCSSLTEITGLSNFVTSSADEMIGMFYGCRSLTSIDVSSFDTSNVVYMYMMFSDCSSLESLDVSGFDTSKAVNMQMMFSGCGNLKTIDISSFNTANVVSMSRMFSGCGSLTGITFGENFTTSNVTDMYCMFSDCNSLASIDVSKFNTSNVIDMCGMFQRCSSLTSLDLSGFDTSRVENMSCMFEGCSSLTSLDVSGFNTSNVNELSHMFQNCESLTSLDVSGFDTSNAQYFGDMFSYCYNLEGLDVSGFDTLNAMNMDYMFAYCTSLTTLDVSNWDTSNANLMTGMFEGCSNLTSIDVSNWDTSNVEFMGYMFYGCSSLTTLDVSNWNTSKVVNMESMFKGCSSLTSIDVSNWDTSSVSVAGNMFENCSSLTLLKVSASFGYYYYVYDEETDTETSTWTAISLPSVDGYYWANANAETVTEIDPNLGSKMWYIRYADGETARINYMGVAQDISKATVTLGTTSYTYDGTAKTPSVTVVYNDETLAEGTDYTVSYSDNTNAGTATVTIIGIGDFAGSTVSKTFTISKADQTVTASASSSSLTVGATSTITASGHGTITYSSSNTSVATVSSSGVVTAVSKGSAVITVKAAGNDNYNEASTTVNITVNAINISGATVTLGTTSYTYDGKAKTPSVTVVYGGKTLVKDTDYTVTYSNNTNAGTGKVTVTGCGNYTGTVSSVPTFTISKATQTVTASAASPSIAYGKTTTITASTTGNGTLSYSSSNTSVATVDGSGKVTAKGAGTATITVTAAATTNYNSATKTVSITVTRAPQSLSVSSSSVTLAVGKTSTPTVSGNKTTLSYSSSDTSVATVNSSGKITAKKVGTATITVTAAQTSQYAKATKTITVKVKPVAPTNVSVTNTSSGVKIAWDKVTGATGYYVYRSTSKNGTYTKIATIKSGSTVTYTNKTSGDYKVSNAKTYYYKVYAYASTGTSSASSVKSIRFITAGKVSSLTNASGGITVKWSKVSGASGYYIYRKAGSAAAKKIATVTGASTVTYTNKTSGTYKVVNGTTYTYYVVPYYKSSSGTVTKGSYSNTKKIVYLTAGKVSSVKNSSSKEITVKWSKNSKATGYQIQYSTSSSFASSKTTTVKVTSKSTVSTTIKKLTKGKTYYVRVRSYKKSGSNTYYSAWSSKKSVKISK